MPIWIGAASFLSYFRGECSAGGATPHGDRDTGSNASSRPGCRCWSRLLSRSTASALSVKTHLSLRRRIIISFFFCFVFFSFFFLIFFFVDFQASTIIAHKSRAYMKMPRVASTRSMVRPSGTCPAASARRRTERRRAPAEGRCKPPVSPSPQNPRVQRATPRRFYAQSAPCWRDEAVPGNRGAYTGDRNRQEAMPREGSGRAILAAVSYRTGNTITDIADPITSYQDYERPREWCLRTCLLRPLTGRFPFFK